MKDDTLHLITMTGGRKTAYTRLQVAAKLFMDGLISFSDYRGFVMPYYKRFGCSIDEFQNALKRKEHLAIFEEFLSQINNHG